MISADDLRSFTLFKAMNPAELDALAQVMHRQSYPADVVLFRKGDPGEAMLLICGGQVRVILNDEHGNEITLRALGEGQILGEFSLLDRQPRSATIASLTPLEVLVLQRDDFVRLLQERPLVGMELMRSLAERVRYATAYLERLYDALELLSNHEYERAIREIALSSDEAGELITTFISMVRRVRKDAEK